MYQMLKVIQEETIQTIVLSRLRERNSLNTPLLQEFMEALTEAEQNPTNRIILIKGQEKVFCTGMDLHSVSGENQLFDSELCMNLLKRLATISRIVIACVDGVVIAGGMGLVAASDIVIATPESQFSLSETLWGLLPCCVLPYLIRRIGFQAAYRLTLTTQTITGEEAHRFQLVDVLTKTLDDEIRKYCLRFKRIHSDTICDLKKYFQKMWLIDKTMEETAVREIKRLISVPRIQHNIANYTKNQKFPWEIEG